MTDLSRRGFLGGLLAVPVIAAAAPLDGLVAVIDVSQNGAGGPFELGSGEGPYPHFLMDGRYLDSILNIEPVDAAGVDVNHETPGEEAGLLNIFSHSVHWRYWPSR